ELRREAQQDLRHCSAGHQLGGKAEEGNGHQRKAVEAGKHLLDDDQERIMAAEPDRQRRGDGQRERDRHAQDQTHEEGEEENRGHGRASPPSSSGLSRRRYSPSTTKWRSTSSKWTAISAKPIGIAA